MIIVVGGVDKSPVEVLQGPDPSLMEPCQDAQAATRQLMREFGEWQTNTGHDYHEWQARFVTWLRRERGFHSVPWGFI